MQTTANCLASLLVLLVGLYITSCDNTLNDDGLWSEWTVEVINGNGFASDDDMYIKAIWMNSENDHLMEEQTEHIDNAANPQWNHVFSTYSESISDIGSINGPYLKTIEFQAWDQDDFGSDDHDKTVIFTIPLNEPCDEKRLINIEFPEGGSINIALTRTGTNCPNYKYGCPSDDYTLCAGEDGQCGISDGYVSYGREPRFYFKPYDSSTKCSNTIFGDPYIGQNKYCCYIPGISVAIFVTDYTSNSERIELELCWNNKFYEGDISTELTTSNTWFSPTTFSQTETFCNDDHQIQISKVGEMNVTFSKVQVIDNSIPTVHTINSFDIGSVTLTNIAPSFIIRYPDDYLTSCLGHDGCIGQAINSNTHRDYSITINQCTTYTKSGSNTSTIGVILRGLNGNLDKITLTGNTFNDVFIGNGNVGDILDILLSYESGSDICIESVKIIDPFALSKTILFEKEYFGNGALFSSSCNGETFTLLSGTNFIPCYDKPFLVKGYEKGIYTSIEIKTCDGKNEAVNTGGLSMTLTGLTSTDRMESFGPYSLFLSTNDWSPNENRDFTFALSGNLKKIAVVSISNTHQTALCIDKVLINGETGFLQEYWVGSSPDGSAKNVIPAVLDWPICKIELTTTLNAASPLPIDPDAVATAVCVNKNRLVPVECGIDQSFETYEEFSWSQEIGEEISTEIALETGVETSVTTSISNEFSAGFTGGIDNDYATALASIGYSQSVGFETSLSFSSSLSVSGGYTSINTVTDGKVNGETKSISCSGSVQVPPSQQIAYSMFIKKGKASITTITDIKMTKCSKFLWGENKTEHDPNDYIYIYGVKGEIQVEQATNCYISFDQATQVNPDPDNINCGKERSLATREWGTYVPICDDIDPAKYSKCQCANGDTQTAATCGCVDESTGNLADTKMASVVDTGSWQKWCNDNCETSFVVPNSFVKEVNPLKEPLDINTFNGIDYSMQMYIFSIAMAVLVTIYSINSLCSFVNKYTKCDKYQPVKQYESEV